MITLCSEHRPINGIAFSGTWDLTGLRRSARHCEDRSNLSMNNRNVIFVSNYGWDCFVPRNDGLIMRLLFWHEIASCFEMTV